MSLIAIVITVAVSTTTPTCLPYGPSEVTVSGTLENLVFPGPPNYESVKQGDFPEDFLYVRLSQPICTIGKNDNTFDRQGLANASLVQLFITDRATYDRFRPHLGKLVSCNGALWNRQTGHHHGDVMFTVKDCRPLSNQPLHPTRASARGSAPADGTTRARRIPS